MATRQNASLEPASTFVPPTSTLSTKEQAKIDFYRTYDPMTGVRIAATLGGFFGLMVILVVCKSKSKTERALEDPNIVAAAVAETEEEERQIEAALQATAYQELNPRRSRKSIDCSSVSPGWIRSTRFSSIGGYSSLMEPPVRLPIKFPYSIDEDSPPEDKSLYEDLSTFYNRYLDVPRRASNITCSSSGSSYLERRGSSVILGLPAMPPHKNRSRRRQSSPLPEQYDCYYPIDIRVTQPTPGGSPCGSERALHDRENVSNAPRLAPLASISSCNSSLGTDYEHSFASDSVFRDECDTDDEIDPFSTDSDGSDTEKGACCRLAEVRKVRTISESSSATVAGTSGEKSDVPSSIPLADSACRLSLLSLERKGWSKETLF